ncbi:MAG: hypothetical protein ACRDRV_21090 [Pseudonocardiaceae bacterium]
MTRPPSSRNDAADGSRWVRIWRRALDSVDTILALTVVVVVGLLDLADRISPDVLNNAILLTLGTLALAMWRDRQRREPAMQKAQQAAEATSEMLQSLPARLDRLAALDELATETRRVLDERHAVRVLTGTEISEVLAEARQDTEEWRFKGATGTFNRQVTLRECVQNARRERRPLQVRIEILDPTDSVLCERYARLYREFASPEDEERGWTGDGTRQDLFATILAACWHKERFPPLDIKIGLSSVLTTFRWDMSSRYLVITQRGPRYPAMMIERDRFYYRWWRMELDQSLEQARAVPLECAVDAPLGKDPGPAEARRLFSALGLELPREYEDDVVADIVVKALSDGSPYAEQSVDRPTPQGERTVG